MTSDDVRRPVIRLASMERGGEHVLGTEDIALGYAGTPLLEKVNVLDPGEQFTLSFSAGGGLEYQLVNRHHAFGLAGQVTVLPEFNNMKFVSTRVFYRYTY